MAAQVDAVRELAGEPDASIERVVWWLEHWLDGDEKVTPLKAFQGWIWAEGFAAGDLVSHFFDDAIPAMRRWHGEGRRLVHLLVRVGERPAGLVRQHAGRVTCCR